MNKISFSHNNSNLSIIFVGFVFFPFLLLLGLLFIKVASKPFLNVQRSVIIEASPAEIWAKISDTNHLLKNLPIGTGLIFPPKIKVQNLHRVSKTLYFGTLFEPQGTKISIMKDISQQEIWLILRKEASSKDWFIVINVESKEKLQTKLTVSTNFPISSFFKIIESKIFIESKLNVNYEAYLHNFKEAIELKIR